MPRSHEGKVGLHDFIKRARGGARDAKSAEQPPESQKQITLEALSASVRELGTAQEGAFEILRALGRRSKEIRNLLDLREKTIRLNALRAVRVNERLPENEFKELRRLERQTENTEEIVQQARGALEKAVAAGSVRDLGEMFPWLKVLEGQAKSPYQTHLERVTGTFEFNLKKLPAEDKDEAQRIAAQISVTHGNDRFLRAIYGPEKNNAFAGLYENLKKQKAGRAAEVSDKAAE